MHGIEDKFKKFGLKVIDCQPTDRSVGITEGWVVFETDEAEVREVSYTEALYLENKEEVIFNSVPYEDE